MLDTNQPAANGCDLLDELHDTLGKYVVFPSLEAQDATTALIAATHAQSVWEHAPRGVFVSPEKRCGKSRLLDIIEATCHKPLITVNVSIAALVRSIDTDDPPTIIIDEADTIFRSRSAENHEEIRGIVNSGFQRNRPYVRWDINTRSSEKCPTFSMVMLAAIGDLPETIMDRAIVVRMRRRSPEDKVHPYRSRRDGPHLHELRDKLSAWVQENQEGLASAEPEMPVDDRAADTWEPLIAVADIAGGDWPERIRKACLSLTLEASASDADRSLGVRLLADIRDLFERANAPYITSKQLVEHLHAIGEAPWSDLNLSMNNLAHRLRPFGIRPRQDASKHTRGYHLSDFQDAFARYLSSNEAAHLPDNSPTNACPEGCPEEVPGDGTQTDAWTGAKDEGRETQRRGLRLLVGLGPRLKGGGHA